MERVIEKKGLPLFIINSTLMNKVSDGKEHWHERIFEVTPLWIGGDFEILDVPTNDASAIWNEYKNQLLAEFRHLNSAVLTSGAAVSGEAVGGVKGRLMSFAHLDLGRYIKIGLGRWRDLFRPP